MSRRSVIAVIEHYIVSRPGAPVEQTTVPLSAGIEVPMGGNINTLCQRLSLCEPSAGHVERLLSAAFDNLGYRLFDDHRTTSRSISSPVHARNPVGNLFEAVFAFGNASPLYIIVIHRSSEECGSSCVASSTVLREPAEFPAFAAAVDRFSLPSREARLRREAVCRSRSCSSFSGSSNRLAILPR